MAYDHAYIFTNPAFPANSELSDLTASMGSLEVLDSFVDPMWVTDEDGEQTEEGFVQLSDHMAVVIQLQCS